MEEAKMAMPFPMLLQFTLVIIISSSLSESHNPQLLNPPKGPRYYYHVFADVTVLATPEKTRCHISDHNTNADAKTESKIANITGVI